MHEGRNYPKYQHIRIILLCFSLLSRLFLFCAQNFHRLFLHVKETLIACSTGFLIISSQCLLYVQSYIYIYIFFCSKISLELVIKWRFRSISSFYRIIKAGSLINIHSSKCFLNFSYSLFLNSCKEYLLASKNYLNYPFASVIFARNIPTLLLNYLMFFSHTCTKYNFTEFPYLLTLNSEWIFAVERRFPFIIYVRLIYIRGIISNIVWIF